MDSLWNCYEVSISGFSVELLRGEYCINAIDCIYVVKCKNVIFANSIIPLFRYSAVPFLPSTRAHSFCSELLWMEVATLNGPLLFGVYYRSPSQSNSDIISLNHCLLSISDYSIVLCGDFNVPNIDWSVGFPTVSSLPANSLCDLVNDNYLSQLVTVPTRGDNILDLLFSNSPNFIANVQVTDNLPGTDHDAI